MKQIALALALTMLVLGAAFPAEEAAQEGAEDERLVKAEAVARKMLDAMRTGDVDTILECTDLQGAYIALRRSKGDEAPAFEDWLKHRRLDMASRVAPGLEYTITGREARDHGVYISGRLRPGPDAEWEEGAFFLTEVDGEWKLSPDPARLRALAQREQEQHGRRAELVARYQQLGRDLDEIHARIAKRGPEFDLATFVEQVEQEIDPPFTRIATSPPRQIALAGGSYRRTTADYYYKGKRFADVLQYLDRIEATETGVAIDKLELAAVPDDETGQTLFTMSIRPSAVVVRPGVERDNDRLADAQPPEDLHELIKEVEGRTSKLQKLARSSPFLTAHVLREVARTCLGGKLPSEEADEPVALEADMAPFFKPSGPWQVQIDEFVCDAGRVAVETSVASQEAAEELRTAFEASPLVQRATVHALKETGDRFSLTLRLLLVSRAQAK